MSQILGIKFNDYGQVYFFSSGPFVVREGQHVIVKTEQGMGLGKCVLVRQAPPEGEGDDEHKAIYRLANDEDMQAVAENDKLSREAYHFCKKCVTKHNLGMKLVDVEVFFDKSKMIFYFTAPGRIDFRELIKDLVREYRTRIELRQIGVRHETQMLGAVGNCGQICCCRRFMRKFVPVTIKMAKEQNLFLNPTKISGICGRLLCCLSFEQEGYEEFNKACPKIGKRFTTGYGNAKVLRSNFFKKSISIFIEGVGERDVPLDEWRDIVNKPLGSMEIPEAKPVAERVTISPYASDSGDDPLKKRSRKASSNDEDSEVTERSAAGAKKRPARTRPPRKTKAAPAAEAPKKEAAPQQSSSAPESSEEGKSRADGPKSARGRRPRRRRRKKPQQKTGQGKQQD